MFFLNFFIHVNHICLASEVKVVTAYPILIYIITLFYVVDQKLKIKIVEWVNL